MKVTADASKRAVFCLFRTSEGEGYGVLSLLDGNVSGGFVEPVISASGEHAAKVMTNKTATLRMKPPVIFTLFLSSRCSPVTLTS
jgi:hypothetical protein